MSVDLANAIEQAWEARDGVTPASNDVREIVEAALELLDSGKARVAEPTASGWPTAIAATADGNVRR